MQSIRRLVDRIFGSKIRILSDIHRIRISELTKNERITRMVDFMVEAGVSIDTIQDGGSTLFYVAIQNAEWDVAEYLLDIGADPKVFPRRKRNTNCVLESDDLSVDQLFSQQVETRIEYYRRLDESWLLKNEDKQFTKRLLFVGQYDTVDVIKSVFEIIPECFITGEDDLLQKYCVHDWIDKYAMIIREGRAVTFNQFRFAFRNGSLEFIQMLCQEGIETFRHFEACTTVTTQASYYFETLISPFRNDEKIGFVQQFIQENKFKGCGQALFRALAVYGCSDLVEKYIRAFHADNVRDSINDDLINGMFRQCAIGGFKEEIDPYSSYINTLKLLITAATRKHDEMIEVDEIFKKEDVKVIARMILEDRIDVVERMILNHVYASADRVAAIDVYNLGVNLACSAVACSDSEMVELLTKQGWDFRSGSCRCRWFPKSPQSPLVCGLKNLLSMKRRDIRTNGLMNENESLENIGKTSNNICHMAEDSSPSDPKNHLEYFRLCREKCVLDVIIFNTDNNYSREFKLELLKRLLDVCDFDLDLPPKPGRYISIYDFFVPDAMVESGMFCLFQAGASTDFIGYFSKEFQERTPNQYRSQIYPAYSYNTNLCRALVSDRENNSFQGQISPDMRSIIPVFQQANLRNALYRSPVFEQLIEEFLEWYRHVTSSPCTLQSECRTVIRKTLILASGHKSILKRIKMLQLPEKLKKFLIYE